MVGQAGDSVVVDKETRMQPSQPPPDEQRPAADIPEGQAPPMPDEDGPHDVPDDKVIEKTLPTGPVRKDSGPS